MSNSYAPAAGQRSFAKAALVPSASAKAPAPTCGQMQTPLRATDMTHSLKEIRPEPLKEQPLAYRRDTPREDQPSYRAERNGIMAGYGGHVPRARDKIAGSAVGLVPHSGHSPQLGLPTTKVDSTPPSLEAYKEKVGGIIPGYAGFVPGSNFKCGESTSKGDITERPPSPGPFWREQPKPPVFAVKPGFGGHMPGAMNRVGGSAFSSSEFGKG